MYTRLQTRADQKIARRLADAAAVGQLTAGQRAVDTATRLLSQLQEAGLPKDKREYIRAVLLEEAFDPIQAEIDRALDNAGWAADLHQLELAELRSA